MTKYAAVTAAQLIQAARRAYEKRLIFLGIFAVVFIGITFVLGMCGLLPEAPHRVTPIVTSAKPFAVASSTPIALIEEPVKIAIPAINLTAVVANPATTDVEVLDADLLKGAVRYPTSAKLGETGNVVLFGHSSYLPVVGNQAYKTFNGIQKLVAGDIVTVSSLHTAYTYRVKSMLKESAASDAGISLVVTGRVLTLATCNSFGAKSDRFIVTADFVESHSIPL